MALETASFVANLVATNPDGGDARSTADDHMRLIKASLVRTFSKLDGAVSLSAAQFMYLNDVSASVQLQLNQLRDGSATANNAINSQYANSASTAANIGTIPAARVPDLAAGGATNNFTANDEALRLSGLNPYLAWYLGATRAGYVQVTSAALRIEAEVGRAIELRTGGATRLSVTPDGTIEVTGLIDGTITNAETATTAATASTATTATTAGFASTCTSASSAALLAGFGPSQTTDASSVAVRNASGDLVARYFFSSASTENATVDSVIVTMSDNYLRKITPANLGAQLETRNITNKSGTTKTLSTSAPSGGSNGDIWYRIA